MEKSRKGSFDWKIFILFLIIGSIASFVVLFVWIMTQPVYIKKPAIYLYPENDSFVNVSLFINGKITKDDPPYTNGWNVFAAKNGIIDGKYDYLFYETTLNVKIPVPKQGWVVSSDNLDNWLDINLARLGLNEKETNQFKEYWLYALPKSNYYFIGLVDSRFLEENVKLVVSPKPDTVIRLIFYFKPLEKSVEAENPEVKTPQRSGFTVVEWGGLVG
jgi:hypothetical protein